MGTMCRGRRFVGGTRFRQRALTHCERVASRHFVGPPLGDDQLTLRSTFEQRSAAFVRIAEPQEVGPIRQRTKGVIG